MAFGDGANNEETEAGAFLTSRERTGNAIEAFENALEFVFGNTNALIFYTDIDSFSVYERQFCTVTLTWGLEYLTALSIRLETADCISSASPRTVKLPPGSKAIASCARLWRVLARVAHNYPGADSIRWALRSDIGCAAPSLPVRRTCSIV